MKKNLALILALVMILGSLFSVVPMAEGDSAVDNSKYVPEIEYANVNYTNKISMMFAVPAPAALNDGEEVKLIVWDSRSESIAFSYNDYVKDVIDAEENLVTIGEQSYLVFKYDGLDATEMTKEICARPVLIKDGVASSYGKVVEYSVVEYVATAKGEIDGIDGIDNADVVELLDDMLKFGGLAQTYSGNEYSFLANDELKSIYVTSVVNGINKGRTFGGFFKYLEGERITFLAPFLDGTTIDKVTDLEGNEIVDLVDYVEGIQMDSVDENLEFVVYYKNAVARRFDADMIGAGVEVNNQSNDVIFADGFAGDTTKITKTTHLSMKLGACGTANLSGAASTLDSANRMNYWHSIKTITDPADPTNTLFQLTATTSPVFNLAQVTPGDFQGVGFGDTIYPAFTFEMTLGALGGKLPTTGFYYFRHRYSALDKGMADLRIFKIVNGQVQIADGTPVDMIPETGMRKFAITVDALTGEAYGYAENLETGEMEYKATGKLVGQTDYNNRVNAYAADPVANANLAMYENVYTFFTKSSKLEPTWEFGAGIKKSDDIEGASVEIDGVMTPVKNADGTFNLDAMRILAERDYSFLLDEFNLVMGFAYDRP